MVIGTPYSPSFHPLPGSSIHNTIYTRMNRWSKAAVLNRVFEQLQRSQVVRIKIEAVSLDSTSIKVHPDGSGALKKTAPRAIGKSRGG